MLSRYLLSRLISGVVSFFIFLTIIFFGLNWLIPGDFASYFMLPQSVQEQIRQLLDLDKPLIAQYWQWLGNLVRGDLGLSYTGVVARTPVNDLIGAVIPATLLVFANGMVVAFGLGFSLGQAAAWRFPRWLTGSATVASIALYTAFPPWLVFLLTLLLVQRLGWLRPASIATYDHVLWRTAPLSPETVMLRLIYLLAALAVAGVIGQLAAQRWLRRPIPTPILLVVLGAAGMGVLMLSGLWPYARSIYAGAALPLIIFILLTFGDAFLITHTSMLETQYETFITTARAKGLPERLVQSRHAARHALLPVLSRLIINLPFVVTGLVIVERATRWHGLGEMLFSAIEQQDTYVYMGIMVLVGAVTLAARLALDILYAVLDPRIRQGFTRREGL